MTQSGCFSIAFFIHDLAGGGVERMRLRLIEGLLARGYDVTLVLQRLSGALCDNVPRGARVIVLGQPRVIGSVLPLARVLRVLKPDFLISSLDHNNVAALCAGMLSDRRIRFIICQHNALAAEAALGWRYRRIPILYRLLSPKADRIVAISHGVADDLSKITGIRRQRITVISNPVIGDDVATLAAMPVPHPWMAEREIPLFVFAGRLVAQKDPQTLLDGFGLLLKRQPARLVILGEGPLRTVLEQRAARMGISSSIVFAGFVADPRPWIQAARALVLTSRYEGLGNVIIEALGCGTPVIATDCPHGPAEILGHGQFGVLVAVGDAAALAAAMSRDLRKSFPAPILRGRAAAYSVDSCVDRHEEIFRRSCFRPDLRAFGLEFTDLDAEAVASQCLAVPPARTQLVVTPNLDHIRLLRQTGFASAYGGADIVCPDGLPVAIYAWLRTGRLPRRVTGCDIVHHLLHHPALEGQRVMVVVESDVTAKYLRDWLRCHNLQDWWLIVVAPSRLGGDEEAQRRLALTVRDFGPRVLLLTLGAPTSEMFVHCNKTDLPACWVLCVGQAVRVEIGAVRRAPQPLRNAGLEWAWRLAQEPTRLLPRYCKAALWFPAAMAADITGHWPRRTPVERANAPVKEHSAAADGP